MTAISRHGDTHRHLATRINLWRHPSPYGDTFPDLATGVAKARQPRELDHILHSVSRPTGTYAIQEMAGWRNKKKAKVEALPPYRHPRWLKGLGVSG